MNHRTNLKKVFRTFNRKSVSKPSSTSSRTATTTSGALLATSTGPLVAYRARGPFFGVVPHALRRHRSPGLSHRDYGSIGSTAMPASIIARLTSFPPTSTRATQRPYMSRVTAWIVTVRPPMSFCR